MMYTQGLKRLTSNQGVIQMLLASSTRSVNFTVAPMRTFAVVNSEQVGIIIALSQGKL